MRPIVCAATVVLALVGCSGAGGDAAASADANASEGAPAEEHVETDDEIPDRTARDARQDRSGDAAARDEPRDDVSQATDAAASEPEPAADADGTDPDVSGVEADPPKGAEDDLADPEPDPDAGVDGNGTVREVDLGTTVTLDLAATVVVAGMHVRLVDATGPDDDCSGCPLRAVIDVGHGDVIERLTYRFSGNMARERAEEARTAEAFGHVFRVVRVVDDEIDLRVG